MEYGRSAREGRAGLGAGTSPVAIKIASRRAARRPVCAICEGCTMPGRARPRRRPACETLHRMALKRIRYEDELDSFRIEGGPDIGFRQGGDLVLPLDAAADVSLAHLANALQRYESYYGGYL